MANTSSKNTKSDIASVAATWSAGRRSPDSESTGPAFFVDPDFDLDEQQVATATKAVVRDAATAMQASSSAARQSYRSGPSARLLGTAAETVGFKPNLGR